MPAEHPRKDMASQAAPCMGMSELGKERPTPPENGEQKLKQGGQSSGKEGRSKGLTSCHS